MLIKHRKAVKAYLLDKSSRKEGFCFSSKGGYSPQVKRWVGCRVLHSSWLLVPNAATPQEEREKEALFSSSLPVSTPTLLLGSDKIYLTKLYLSVLCMSTIHQRGSVMKVWILFIFSYCNNLWESTCWKKENRLPATEKQCPPTCGIQQPRAWDYWTPIR